MAQKESTEQHQSPEQAGGAIRWRRRAVAGVLAVVATLALAGCWSTDQAQDLTLISQTREAHGKAAAVGDQAVMDKAQRWSRHMAVTGRLEHTGGGGNIDTSGIPRWCAVGENVGSGTSLQAVHATFVGSPAHVANMVGPFNRVGTGVVRRGGQVWVTEIYYRAC